MAERTQRPATVGDSILRSFYLHSDMAGDSLDYGRLRAVRPCLYWQAGCTDNVCGFYHLLVVFAAKAGERDLADSCLRIGFPCFSYRFPQSGIASLVFVDRHRRTGYLV